MIKGVYRTRVGYAGGTSADPTYRNMGDHTESMQIDFASNEISFEQIADLFWQSHNPCATRGSRQYMSAIWFHNENQKLTIEKIANELSASHGEIVTLVEPLQSFYLAEDYHQKYRLQRFSKLMSKFRAWYPEFEDLNNSHAAARLNGILGDRNLVVNLSAEETEQLGFEAGELTAAIR